MGTSTSNRHPQYSSKQQQPCISVRVGTMGGPETDVEIRSFPALIGRQADAEVHLRDRFASKVHALLNHVNGEFVVQDLESRNGIQLDGRPTRFSRLRPGDVITLGVTQIKIMSVADEKNYA